MENALSEYQTLVLVGGTSDIGLAIVRELTNPATRRIVLACRDVSSAAGVAAGLGETASTADDLQVDVVPFDAADPASHARFVDDLGTRFGDLDVVILAHGVLGAQSQFDDDPLAAAQAVSVNYTGSVSVGLAFAKRLRQQGHGTLVVMSSVAGERVRKANFVYGSSKAGLDGFAQGLGDALAGSGARVLVVRPGFVHSKMTAGHAPPPFATTPEDVAVAVAKGLRSKRRTVWVPAILQPMFSVLRHLPGPIWRRLPLG